MFTADIYSARREELCRRVGKGLILLPGNVESPFNYPNNTYHFRQDSSFLYYFASDYEGLAAIIDIDNDKEIIFGDELTIDAIVWTGVQPTIKEKCERVGITLTRPMADLATYLKDAQANPDRYRQLVVRIWGWSAYFVELDKEFQDHVIARQVYQI